MLPGIFYAHLREMARISEKSPGVALAPLCRGSLFRLSGASKPLSGGILLLLRTLRQINLENGRKVCYNLG